MPLLGPQANHQVRSEKKSLYSIHTQRETIRRTQSQFYCVVIFIEKKLVKKKRPPLPLFIVYCDSITYWVSPRSFRLECLPSQVEITRSRSRNRRFFTSSSSFTAEGFFFFRWLDRLTDGRQREDGGGRWSVRREMRSHHKKKKKKETTSYSP